LAKSSRRRFLLAGTTLAAAGCSERRGPWRALAEDEVHTLDALCDQLIPADQDPGAHATGVVVYIDRQLAGPYRRHLEAYRAGLANTGDMSRAAYGKRFFELEPEQRLAICRRLEQEQKPFFDLVLAHAMQGYYGNPRHGGNREYASWRMLGVSVTQVRGRNLYDLRKGGA
jgi:gluconate 2-dehydrogenase gamma chain